MKLLNGRIAATAFISTLLAILLVVGGIELFSPTGFSFANSIGADRPEHSIGRWRISVTDGDTIRVFGESAGTRLIGFNTPETFSPQCENERALGARATARLKELVATSELTLEKVPCACEPGTEGTDRCNFGRSCGIFRADGRDVGDILISEGLAARFVCGRTNCPRLPRPWCG